MEWGDGRHRRPGGLAAWTASGLVLLVALSIWFAAGVQDNPSELQLFLGRLHPLIVHLPIGFILLTVALEALGRTRRFVRVRHAVPLALVISVVSAVAAVLAGYLLGESGGYAGELVAWHERLGIAVAATVLLAAALRHAAARRRNSWLRTAYTASLATTVMLLLAAGHLGGTLTRGPDYLAEYMPAPLVLFARLLPAEQSDTSPGFSYPDEAVIYEHLVAPVLRERCVTCHGPDRQKGDLRLDSPQSITAGGTSGPVLVPGRAAESRLVRRIWLPPGHEEVMPPSGRPPLSAAEAELLRWWVEAGASFDAVVGRSVPPPAVLAILEQVAGSPEERVPAVLRTEISPADSTAVAAARGAGLSLRPLSERSHFLRASCSAPGEACGGHQLHALLPLAEQLAELDLSDANVGDADLEVIGRLRHLTRLSLDRTAVGDAGLIHLRDLRHLEYLNLYDTAVTDAGLVALEALPNLRSLYLWKTDVTEAGSARLAGALANVKISLGIPAATIDSLSASGARGDQLPP